MRQSRCNHCFSFAPAQGLEFAAEELLLGGRRLFLGLLFLLFLYFRNRRKYIQKIKKQVVRRDFGIGETIYRILALSIPITLGSLVIPVVNMIDLSVVPLRLHQVGYSTKEATALYGQLTGMANSIIQFPLILTIALAMSLVPAISEAQTLRNDLLVKNRTELAMRFTLFFSIPASFGLYVLAKPTTIVLFENAPAAYPLAMMSFGLIFMSLYIATSGILQGLGYVLEPVKYMVFGTIIKFVLSWYWTADPRLHIGGAALATVASFFIASLLNIRKVSKITGWRFNFNELLFKPLVAASFMAWSVHLAYGTIAGGFLPLFSARLAQALSLLLSILIGLFIFVLVMFLVRAVRKEDLEAVPHIGPHLVKLTRKLNLLGR